MLPFASNIFVRLVHLSGYGVLLAALLAVLALAVRTDPAAAQTRSGWSATLGGDGDDFAHAVALASDGGYVIAGETRSPGAASRDGWLIKLDDEGAEAWSRTYGMAGDDAIYAIQATTDGGYVLAGGTIPSGEPALSRSDFWLIKVDSDGYEQWQRNYGNSEGSVLPFSATSDTAHSVRQTSDGGYILAGKSTGESGSSIWLLKTGIRGNLEWNRDLGGASGSIAYDVVETSSGDFVMAGNTSSSENGRDATLIKVDSGGRFLWSKSLGGNYNDEARSVVETNDGGFVIGGFTWSHGAGLSDFWLVRVDGDGDLEWQRSFGGVPRDAAHSVVQTDDGGFALAGWSESFSGGDRFWVVKTDESGQLQWSGAYPGDSRADGSGTVSAGARALQQTSDGGFIVAGWTGDIRGVRDVMVVKTGPIETGIRAHSGVSVVLENRGAANITSAAVGFDTVFFGRPLRFWYKGRLIDQDNPLPTGGVACTQPAPALVDGSQLTLDQIGSYEVAYLDSMAGSGEATSLTVDGEAFHFDLDGVAGSLKFVSEPVCEGSDRLLPEGPRPPVGLSGTATVTYPGSITLDWVDSPESDIFGYSVYVSRRGSGPFVRRAWLLSESGFADTGPTDGASYYYAVSAINSRGLESPKSTVERITSTDFAPPAPPSGLKVTSLDSTDRTATLKWSASPDADISGYRVYRQDGDSPRAPVTALLFAPLFVDLTVPVEDTFSYSVTGIDLAGNESDWSNIAPPPLDFFGAVVDIRRNFIDQGSLSVSTSRGRVDIDVGSDTEVRVPGRELAGLGDLAIGDQVAVSLSVDAGSSVASQVHLVPSNTRNRHLVGTVSSLTDGRVGIQPRDGSSDAVNFLLPDSVVIKFHQGGVELGVGDFIVASYLAADDRTEPTLIEIDVISGPEPTSTSAPVEEPSNVALVRGVFQGINAVNANIILSSTEVTLDANTEMTAGISVGDAVLVEAELLPDGSLLARRLEHDKGIGRIAARTVLQGVFQGHDAGTGRWTVSGTELAVDSHTYTDFLPTSGQRIEVSAIVREDGTLYAREVENLRGTVAPDIDHTVWIEGVFNEISAFGAWNVGGVPIKVDANTVLSGRPSVGRRVAVTATGGRGSLLATEVSAAASEQDILVRSVSIRGTIESLMAGQWLVVDGMRVSQSDLTSVVGDLAIGDAVLVEAELQADGSLLAREVAISTASDATVETRANPVDIEGRIERVDSDGGLVVNGIPVASSALTTVDATLRVGSPVQVRGLLQRDGSVLAREIVGYGPGIAGGTEASVSGVVETVSADSDGRVSGFVVDGIAIIADRLTRTELDLTVGVAVLVQAIVVNGDILAVTVEPRPSASVGVLPSVQMQGTIERPFATPAPFPIDIVVNGVTVRISDDTEIAGAISGGSVVKVSGSISGGIFLARQIESVPSVVSEREERVTRFILRGIVEEVRLDDEEQPEALLLAGNLITIVPLTIVQEEVAAGDSIVAQGIVRDGALLAALIRQQ